MEYTKGHLVYFSPTSSSKQVATSIVHGAGIENVSELDLTRHSPGAVQIPSDSLTVIAVPVYGGRVAPLAMQRMKDITGDNTPVVLIAVYGNRAYEKALAELDAYAIGHGFKVIAAATFIGEHSFSTAQNPISKDRPNQDDLTLAREFGNKIIAKITAAADMEHLYSVDVTRIQRPKQPLFPLLGFLRQMIKLRKSGVPMPKPRQPILIRVFTVANAWNCVPTMPLWPGMN